MKRARAYSTATTTSDAGESLAENDLEWDESDFHRHLPESDALSAYDVNEMAEILRNHFLEFDMVSQSILSRQSTISDACTVDLRSMSNVQRVRRTRSVVCIQEPVDHAKRLSLPDVRAHLAPTKATYHPLFCSTAQLMEVEPEPELFHIVTTMNFSHLSKLAKIRIYLKTFQDKLRSFLSRKLQPPDPPTLIDNIIDTYDIIDG